MATLLCRLTSKYLGDLAPKYAAEIDSFVATSLVVAAFDLSGGYYNPVLATGLKMGCKGHTNIEFLIVYWIGASLGAIGWVLEALRELFRTTRTFIFKHERFAWTGARH